MTSGTTFKNPKPTVDVIIELADAQITAATAAAQRVAADYNLAASRAQLLKALGRD